MPPPDCSPDVRADTLTDTELVACIADANPQALECLHVRHGHLVFRLAWRVLHNRADAEEVRQDVFMQVWRQSARFSAVRGNVQAWLRTITRTRAIDLLRQRRRMDHELLDDDVGQTASPLARDTDSILRRAVQALPAYQRVALELSLYEGLTHVEIARALGEPLGTIKSRIRTSLTVLRSRCLTVEAASDRSPLRKIS